MRPSSEHVAGAAVEISECIADLVVARIFLPPPIRQLEADSISIRTANGLGIPKEEQPRTHDRLLGVNPAERDPEVIEETVIVPDAAFASIRASDAVPALHLTSTSTGKTWFTM